MTRTVHTRVLDALRCDRYIHGDLLRRKVGGKSWRVNAALVTLERLGLIEVCRMRHLSGPISSYRRVTP